MGENGGGKMREVGSGDLQVEKGERERERERERS